jgi:hypothetical protein
MLYVYIYIYKVQINIVIKSATPYSNHSHNHLTRYLYSIVIISMAIKTVNNSRTQSFVFGRVCIVANSTYSLRHVHTPVCLSVHPYLLTRFALNGFPWNLVLWGLVSGDINLYEKRSLRKTWFQADRIRKSTTMLRHMYIEYAVTFDYSNSQYWNKWIRWRIKVTTICTLYFNVMHLVFNSLLYLLWKLWLKPLGSWYRLCPSAVKFNLFFFHHFIRNFATISKSFTFLCLETTAKFRFNLVQLVTVNIFL